MSLLVAAALTLTAQSPPRLRVQFIDVGQADATLLTDDRGCVMLIDSADTRYPESASNFKAYLTKALPKGSTINLVVASHPHNDHIGNMRWVLDTYHVGTYIDSGQFYPSPRYSMLMTTVNGQRRTGMTYYTYANAPADLNDVCHGVGGPQVHVLYPKNGFDTRNCVKAPNNCSVVVSLAFGRISFLFPGDAEEEEEALLLRDQTIRPQLAATVLKVPNHGSNTSSSQDFLNAVHPEVMVISVGTKNVGTNTGYEHPKLATVRRLLQFAGARQQGRQIDAYDADQETWKQINIFGGLYDTAKDGTVILETDGVLLRHLSIPSSR